MAHDYLCNKCGYKGVFFDLAFWTDDTYRCPVCFGDVGVNKNFNTDPYVTIKAMTNRPIVAIIIDGLYIAGMQCHCIQLSSVFKKLGFQIMIIAVEGGGAWYKKFLDIADFIFVPGINQKISWVEIEKGFGSKIIGLIEFCSCHLVIPIQWGIEEIPSHIRLFAHLHSEPSEHEIVSPLFFKQQYFRAERILFPTFQTLNAYKTLFNSDSEKLHVLINGFSESLSLHERKNNDCNDTVTKIAVISRIDCDKFAFSLFKNTLITMSSANIIFEIIIAGNGDSMSSLIEIITDLKLDNQVKLIGFLNDPTPLYQWADLVFLPSKRESMPYVMLESIRFQTPIVLPLLGIAIDNNSITGVFSFESNNHFDVVSKIILAKQFSEDKRMREMMLTNNRKLTIEWEEEVKNAYKFI